LELFVEIMKSLKLYKELEAMKNGKFNSLGRINARHGNTPLIRLNICAYYPLLFARRTSGHAKQCSICTLSMEIKSNS
jgi:hypothetical protein